MGDGMEHGMNMDEHKARAARVLHDAACHADWCRLDYGTEDMQAIEVLNAAGLLAPPPPVWVPLAEAQPDDGQAVWVSDGCGVWFRHAADVRRRRWALTGSHWVDHDDSLVAALSWVPASVPEPPEEGEVER